MHVASQNAGDITKNMEKYKMRGKYRNRNVEPNNCILHTLLLTVLVEVRIYAGFSSSYMLQTTVHTCV